MNNNIITTSDETIARRLTLFIASRFPRMCPVCTGSIITVASEADNETDRYIMGALDMLEFVEAHWPDRR
jgi:hypothetical protein